MMRKIVCVIKRLDIDFIEYSGMFLSMYNISSPHNKIVAIKQEEDYNQDVRIMICSMSTYSKYYFYGIYQINGEHHKDEGNRPLSKFCPSIRNTSTRYDILALLS
jgi:hypothetical protein